MDENKIIAENNAQETTNLKEDQTNITDEHQMEKTFYTCSKCGNVIPDNCNFCPKCGTQKVNNNIPSVCKKCGAILMPGQEFCANCGHKNKAIKNKKKSKKRIILALVAVAVAVLVAIIIAVSAGGSKDLNSVYSSVVDGSSIYVDITSDGKSISVDTNPYNIEDYYSSEASEYVKAINNALGLPNSVYDKMQTTSALDGRISEEYGDIRVSWKYHPDKGLQVIYEVIEK